MEAPLKTTLESMNPESKETILKWFDLTVNQIYGLISEAERIVDATLTRKPADALGIWGQIEQKVKNQATNLVFFQQLLAREINQITSDNRKTVNDANGFKDLVLWILIALCAVAFVLAISIGALFSYIFTRPLRALQKRFVGLAEGDLATQLTIPNQDELGELGRTFNESINKLGDLVEQVQTQSFRISSAAAQIAGASRISANSSSDQAGAVAEATVTIEELNHTAREIAEAASLVAGAAEQALSSANQGQEAVKESISGINRLKVQVQEIAEKILALNERSQRVGHIIEQITSIADQTHLLALNAAIESAAAGESGKRFAVVAAEVKKLAERSRTATREVQAVLTEIQFATAASVMATEQGMKQAEHGVLLAHRSGDANESIMQMIERTVQLSSAISLATQQQRNASEQVASSMRQLATVIQDGAASARQSSSLASSLDEVASELRVVSNQFKVSSEDLAENVDFDDEGNLLDYSEDFANQPGIGLGSSDGGIPDYQTKSL
jgi:methyl-accepting chemotaxis protein